MSLALVNEEKSHEERRARVSEFFLVEIGKTPEGVKQLQSKEMIQQHNRRKLDAIQTQKWSCGMTKLATSTIGVNYVANSPKISIDEEGIFSGLQNDPYNATEST